MWQLIKEIIQFAIKEKKWWLIPMFIILLIIGFLIILGAGSPIAPFLYPLF
jgi:competence protein ComGC